MQTILSKVTMIFIKTFAAQDIVKKFSLSAFEFHGNLSRHLAISWLLTEYYFMILMYVALLCLLIVKYLSIYHSTCMAGIDEISALRKYKIFLLVAPIIIALYEYTFVTQFDELSYFQMKHFGKAWNWATRSQVISCAETLKRKNRPLLKVANKVTVRCTKMRLL